MELKVTLTRLLKERRLSVEALARQMQVSPSTLKAWTAGSAPRNLDDVRTVASCLGVSFEYLIFGEDTSSAHALEQQLLEQVFDGFLKVRIERVIPSKKASPGREGK